LNNPISLWGLFLHFTNILFSTSPNSTLWFAKTLWHTFKSFTKFRIIQNQPDVFSNNKIENRKIEKESRTKKETQQLGLARGSSPANQPVRIVPNLRPKVPHLDTHDPHSPESSTASPKPSIRSPPSPLSPLFSHSSKQAARLQKFLAVFRHYWELELRIPVRSGRLAAPSLLLSLPLFRTHLLTL
jgi:hypothetical protein